MPVPQIHPYQTEGRTLPRRTRYKEEPYKEQRRTRENPPRTRKNPFTQSEISVERIQSRPVGHPEIVDSTLLTHYRFRLDFPQQFDIIAS